LTTGFYKTEVEIKTLNEKVINLEEKSEKWKKHQENCRKNETFCGRCRDKLAK
jgi:hypothetical protein